MELDVSKNWVISAAKSCAAASVKDLAAVIAALRRKAGCAGGAPECFDAESGAPADAAEIIVNCDLGSRKNSFAWRAGAERIEIYGHSLRSLDNAIFDFIAALGVHLDGAQGLTLPQPVAAAVYALQKKSEHTHHDAAQKTLCIKQIHNYIETRTLILWAAHHSIDEIILSLQPRCSEKEQKMLEKLCAEYHLEIARGGHELALLVPRKLFLLHRDLFRMDEGRRKKDYNFCASNHKTQAVIKQHATRWFNKYYGTKKYYFLPEGGFEQDSWCSCPACRAFSFEEQNMMAINSAADALATIDTEAYIYYARQDTETDTVLQTRKNTKSLNLPINIQ